MDRGMLKRMRGGGRAYHNGNEKVDYTRNRRKEVIQSRGVEKGCVTGRRIIRKKEDRGGM